MGRRVKQEVESGQVKSVKPSSESSKFISSSPSKVEKLTKAIWALEPATLADPCRSPLPIAATMSSHTAIHMAPKIRILRRPIRSIPHIPGTMIAKEQRSRKFWRKIESQNKLISSSPSCEPSSHPYSRVVTTLTTFEMIVKMNGSPVEIDWKKTVP